MLTVARSALGDHDTRLDLARIEDPLPRGPFGLAVSALTVHHLDSADKAALFTRIAGLLEWLTTAGLTARVHWERGDLAVLVGDRATAN